MSTEDEKIMAELRYWLYWTARQLPGSETEILFAPGELGAIIINLN